MRLKIYANMTVLSTIPKKVNIDERFSNISSFNFKNDPIAILLTYNIKKQRYIDFL